MLDDTCLVGKFNKPFNFYVAGYSHELCNFNFFVVPESIYPA